MGTKKLFPEEFRVTATNMANRAGIEPGTFKAKSTSYYSLLAHREGTCHCYLGMEEGKIAER